MREALQLAIDRNALAETAGVTARPAEGLVPPGVPENEEGDFRTVGGALLDNDPETYGERRDRARELLSEAGYDSGSDLGELEYLYEELVSTGLTAQGLGEQWRVVLGGHVTPRGVTEQELWAALRSGSYTVAGVELTGNGNDAECFLSTWTSHDPDNVARYENSAYDTLMAIIANAPDGTARMGCLHDAEELLISANPSPRPLARRARPLSVHHSMGPAVAGRESSCRDGGQGTTGGLSTAQAPDPTARRRRQTLAPSLRLLSPPGPLRRAPAGA